MLVKEFVEEVQKTYGKYFPQSKCYISMREGFYKDITIRCYLANNREEVANGIWQNDMFSVLFSIELEDGELPKDLTMESELPKELVMVADHKNYTTVPNDEYMAYGRQTITYRKTKGDGDKLIKTLDKFFSRLCDSLLENLENDMIHKNHIDLLNLKLTKWEKVDL